MKIQTTLILSAAFITIAAGVFAAVPAPPVTAVNSTAAVPPAGIQRLKLWDKAPGLAAGADADTDPAEPTIDLYLPPPEKASGTAILILPGGGYTHLSTTKEGSDVANVFLAHNVAAFVVRYRMGTRYHYPIPLLDAQRALRTVRSNAADYKLNPAHIGILGFSAGGHLAAMTATMYDNGPKPEAPDAIDAISAKPNFAILMYPVINFTDDTLAHKGSRTSLTNNDPSLYALLSPEQHVTKDSPPMFFVHGSNDRTVPVMNSIVMYEACLKAGVPAELHILEDATHGFGLGPNDPIQKTWPDMAVRWLEHNKFLPK